MKTAISSFDDLVADAQQPARELRKSRSGENVCSEAS
jgi:hypothetical protein